MNVLSLTAGLTHLYNQDILQRSLPEFHFTGLLDKQLNHLRGLKAVHALDIDIVTHESHFVDDSLWHPPPDLLFFSIASPNPFRCRLLQRAIHLNIPILAVQEVNQMANHVGELTHYFLPVDQLGVASNYEADVFQKLGYQPEQTILTGWPFYSANKLQPPTDKGKLKKDLGFKTDTKIGLLILGFLKERSIESFETIRTRQGMLRNLSEGLPRDVILLVKPHPAEDTAIVKESLNECAPGAIVMDSKVPIEDALAISDLVISRGNSQVMFEAMLRGIPLVIVPLGLRTLFDDLAPELIATSPDQLREVCERILKNAPDYSEVLSVHAPLSEDESIERTAAFFRKAILNSPLMPVWSKRLDLCLQMKFSGMDVEACEELDALRLDVSLPQEYRSAPESLGSLFEDRAEPAEIAELVEIFENHRIRQWHIQALWIRQMHRFKRDRNLLRSGLPLIQSFDGSVNPHYFIKELMMRMDLEYREGNEGLADRFREWFQRDYYFYPPFQGREIRLRLFRDKRVDKDLLKMAGWRGYKGLRKGMSVVKRKFITG